MKTTIKNMYPLIITGDIKQCAQFYIELFDFDIVFESDWYFQLLSSGGVELGILIDNAQNQPKFLHNAYNGQGVTLTFEVANAKIEYDRLVNKGVNFLLDYTEEQWGQKHFIIQDPAGMFIDIVGQTQPEDY